MFTALPEENPSRRISIRLRRLFLVRLVTTGISTFSRRSSVRKGGLGGKERIHGEGPVGVWCGSQGRCFLLHGDGRRRHGFVRSRVQVGHAVGRCAGEAVGRDRSDA